MVVLTSFPNVISTVFLVASVVALFLSNTVAAVPAANSPILISESSSTRAIALESITLTREPFAPTSPFGASGQRTRVMLFAMNLGLQPGEDLSVITADAEDASHRHYALTVEAIRPVPSHEWMNAVVLRLHDEMGNIGDVLVSVSYRGVMSNRVRIAIGHAGGGPADDSGSTPTPAPPYTISGQLVNGSGQPLSGISVALSGAQSATVVSAADGSYSFTISTFGDYVVTPITNAYYSFTPQVFNQLQTNRVVNFTGTLRFYTVSGRLQIGADPVPGVVVPVTGSQIASTTTNANGEYSFSLPAGGNYTIAPALIYHDILPGNLAITDLTGDRPNSNFFAIRRNFAISGKLRNQEGNGLPGITVNLTGAQQRSTVSDANGNYQFAALPAGFDYSVTPQTNPYYSFTTSQNFLELIANQVADFAGTLRFYTVSGWAQLGPFPAVNLDIPITGSITTTVKTDENGNYAISLPAGGNYTLTPSVTYYTFDPVSQVVNDLSSHQGTRFFVGHRQLFVIRGKIKDLQNNGLPGIIVHLSGAEQRTTVTDAGGNYQFPNLLAGFNYAVGAPSTELFTFPAGQNVTDLRSDQTVDMVGLRRLLLNGRVVNQNGDGIIGVTVTLAGTESASTKTSGDGSYSLRATETGNYTVTPTIAQDYYSFAPASLQFNNLNAPHLTDFAATLAPVPDPQYVLEFDGQPKAVDHLSFWQDGVDLGHFFWELWAMPGEFAAATYMLSDGYGGSHALLFGVHAFNSSEPDRYELAGNLFDGLNPTTTFGSDVGPAINEWGHYAVGWDGQSVITYFNGVPVGKVPFSGPRRTPGPGGGGGRLLIGGSDHSNFQGRIAQVRGYENTNPREALPGGVEAAFAPQTVFAPGGSLMSNYFRLGSVVADLSGGYNGVAHEGFLRGTIFGVPANCVGCPPPQHVIDPTAPNFATGAASAPVNVPSTPATPVGALVFDSFARPNATYTFGGLGGLGSTESGSAGPRTWQTNNAPQTSQPFGILNARAVLLGNTQALAWVPTGSATGDVDVRVDRYKGRWGSGIHTGLSFRVVDAQNFFFAYTTDTGDPSNPKVVRVGYYLNGQRTDLTAGATLPANWTTLRVVTLNSGDLKVYADGSLVFFTNNTQFSSAAGAGLYSNSSGLGLVNRWDNFTVFPTP